VKSTTPPQAASVTLDPNGNYSFPANQGSQGLVSEASGALNFPPRVAGGWTRMAIPFSANQGSQGFVSEASGALNFPPRVAGGWTRMAIPFPANQGSQALVSEASGALNFPPRGSERGGA